MTTTTDPDQAYFQLIPWCQKLLDDRDLVIIATPSRQYKESTEDALFAETLNTQETIRACLSFYKQPPLGVSHVHEVCMLVSLGYRVNGYPHLCHGGIIATILDEVMGNLLTVNKNMEHAAVRGTSVTAYLNVTYLKPVVTPLTILLTARFREITGRKYYVDASIEDGNKAVLAKAEALFIRVDKLKETL
ncbi:MAG: hypothetical protein Q9187_001011 [Circinaria calcarea]